MPAKNRLPNIPHRQAKVNSYWEKSKAGAPDKSSISLRPKRDTKAPRNHHKARWILLNYGWTQRVMKQKIYLSAFLTAITIRQKNQKKSPFLLHFEGLSTNSAAVNYFPNKRCLSGHRSFFWQKYITSSLFFVTLQHKIQRRPAINFSYDSSQPWNTSANSP